MNFTVRVFLSLCVLLFSANNCLSTHASPSATGDLFLKTPIRPGYAEAAGLQASLGLQMDRHVPGPQKNASYRLKATEVEDEQEDEQVSLKRFRAVIDHLAFFYHYSSGAPSPHDLSHQAYRPRNFSYLSSRGYIALRVIRI